MKTGNSNLYVQARCRPANDSRRSPLKDENDVGCKQEEMDKSLEDIGPAAGEGDDTHNQSQGQKDQPGILQPEVEDSAGEMANHDH